MTSSIQPEPPRPPPAASEQVSSAWDNFWDTLFKGETDDKKKAAEKKMAMYYLLQQCNMYMNDLIGRQKKAADELKKVFEDS